MRLDRYMQAGMTFAEAAAARRADKEKNAATNAAKRQARQAAIMHCQCCGRDILANKGTIAHHGYQRPGYGWQTSSCMGARALPFEAARDKLGEMIEFMRAELKRRKTHRKAIEAEKLPIVFNYKQDFIGPIRHYNFNAPRWNRAEWPKVEMRFNVTRASWNEFKAGPGRNEGYGMDFDAYKAAHIRGLTSAIKNLTDHIALEQGRYDGWKQTHKWVANEWKELKGKRK